MPYRPNSDELRRTRKKLKLAREALREIAGGQCCETPGCCGENPSCDTSRAKGALEEMRRVK